MMRFSDYHVHSLSPDARVPMEAVCEAALARGLNEIAITDHMEMYSPEYRGKETGIFSEEFVIRYFDELEKVRARFAGRLDIRAGVELGQPAANSARAQRLLREHPYDFVLGSVHKLHDVDLAFKVYTRDTVEPLCERYLEKLYELADTGDFDVLAHFDLIHRYAHRQGVLVDVMRYREAVERILRRLAERGKGLEVNTSGLRQATGATMPGPEVLKLFRELGGEVVTVGSDAHTAGDIAANLEEARALAREAGFSRLASFQNRACVFYDL